MRINTPNTLEASWVRLGVAFNCPAASSSPDLERLLIETAVGVPQNARLLPLVVTWLVRYGSSVARHRLKRLILTECPSQSRAILGFILESAVALGAPREFRTLLGVCRPTGVIPQPLFDVQRGKAALERLAEKNSSELARKWGFWAPATELKEDAIRPVTWLLAHNPGFEARFVRKGDLRCSILETLRWDTSGEVRSESELARLVAATRKGTQEALSSLRREGQIEPRSLGEASRDHRVVLQAAA